CVRPPDRNSVKPRCAAPAAVVVMLPPSSSCRISAVCSASVTVSVTPSLMMLCSTGVVNCCTSTSKVSVSVDIASGVNVVPNHSQLPPHASPTSTVVSSGNVSSSGPYHSH